MNSVRLLKLLSICVAVFCLFGCKNEVKKVKKSSDNERPNILYIMSDDHASNAISAYGSRLKDIAPTPNIDRIAKEGILMENVFYSILLV